VKLEVLETREREIRGMRPNRAIPRQQPGQRDDPESGELPEGRLEVARARVKRWGGAKARGEALGKRKAVAERMRTQPNGIESKRINPTAPKELEFKALRNL
jgi:hypothetical protein